MSRKVALGRWANGVGSGFGLRTSLPGRNALSSDNRDLSFSSDWATQLPVLLRGSLTLAGNSPQSIGYPNQGYTPQAQFLQQGIVNSADPVNDGSQYVAYQGLADSYQATDTYLLMEAFADHLRLNYRLYKDGNDTFGYPNNVGVAYVVYKIPAFY